MKTELPKDLSVSARLSSFNQRALEGGGADKIDKQHQEGKLTARERIDRLFDPGTFTEMDRLVTHQCHDFDMQKARFPGDGVVTGHGLIDGRPVFAFAQDFTVMGGSLGPAHARKIIKIQDLSLKVGAPLVGLNDSGGARIQEGVAALGGYADIFLRNALSSGVVPQISAIMGPCAGGAVYSPALTDFVLMVKKTSHMFVTGPDVVQTVTHEAIDKETLGGAETHNSVSGVAHFLCENGDHCLGLIRDLLSYLPANFREDPPIKATRDSAEREEPQLDSLVPEDPKKAYDIRTLITAVADDSTFLEVQPSFATNIVTGFARIEGRPIGIVANQPKVLAGCLDIQASIKAARFVRFCDCFNIPLVTFVDVPGFLPGRDQEHGGIIKHGAKLLYAYCEATVPKISVITRKAYGGAYDVMNSKHIRSDVNFAFPTAQIAVMGAEGAANILYRKAIANAASPDEERARHIEVYRDTFLNPFRAAELGFVDEIIEPRRTRPKLAAALRLLANKRDQNPPRKHDNLPL